MAVVDRYGFTQVNGFVLVRDEAEMNRFREVNGGADRRVECNKKPKYPFLIGGTVTNTGLYGTYTAHEFYVSTEMAKLLISSIQPK